MKQEKRTADAVCFYIIWLPNTRSSFILELV